MIPGIYERMPFDEYLRIDAFSNSRGKDVDVSPLYCQERIASGGEAESDAMKLGSADHCGLLEPHDLDKRFAPRPEMFHPDTGAPRNANYGPMKEAIGSLEAQGFTVLKADEYDKAARIREICETHRGARTLLDNRTHNELTCVSSVFDETGLASLCKVRIDFACEDIGVLVEVKTTTDLSDFALAKKIGDMGYHRGLAMYQNVARNAGLDLPTPVILWFNTSPKATPSQMVRTTAIPQTALDLGREEYRRSLAIYAACKASGNWPGPPDDIEEIDLTPWYYSRAAERNQQ